MSKWALLRCRLPVMAALICIAGSYGCKTSHKTATPVVKEWKKPEDKSAPDLQQLINNNAFKARTVSAKANVKYVQGDQSNSFNINLRIQTDSLVWISISPLLGIEVTRILITKDSIKYLDRLNNRYALSDFGFLNELLQVNIDFDIIQGILTGNLFAYKKNKFNSVYLEDRYYILSTLSKRKLKRSLEDIDITRPVVQDMWVEGNNYRIIRLSIEDQRMNKSLLTDYTNLKETEGGLFPFNSTTIINSDQEIRIDIDFSRVTVNNNLEFPFNIPSGYEKIN